MTGRARGNGGWLVEKGSALLATKTSRRGFLMRAAVAGTAVAVNPVQYLLRPGTAYAAVCGCGGFSCNCDSYCCEGYTAFCCEVTGGVNACPAGSFPGGWWRADGSIFCDGTRYIVDCNLSCDADWWPGCGCAQGDCGRRVSSCNWFRYGQCNEHISCYGPIVCRMATCAPPYVLDLGCSDWTLWDNSTANHGADCSSDGSDVGGGSRGGGGGEGEAAEEPSSREAERAARSAEREAERTARSAEREAEREQRRLEREAERGSEDS